MMDIKTRGGGDGGVARSQWALEDGATRLDNDSVYLRGRATDRMSDSRLSGEQLTVCLSVCLSVGSLSPFCLFFIRNVTQTATCQLQITHTSARYQPTMKRAKVTLNRI